jgi:putative tryptophan/tyrosine transport system substrate-binding protein
MRRRQFISLLGGAAVWPLGARAQQPAMPVIGFLNGGAQDASTGYTAAFRKGLSESGYAEGRNVTIEYRWAANENDQLLEFAADLVRRRVAAIVTTGSQPAILAAKALTSTIPIVFYTAGDPVQAGVVASLNRPGGNVTGITSMGGELGGKRLELLHELVPGAARLAVLVNPTSPTTEFVSRDMQAAAAAIGRQIEILTATTSREIDTAFKILAQKRADALFVTPDSLFNNHRVQLQTLAARHGVPAIYPVREYAEAGGLMSYGTSIADVYRQVGIYTGRILKGDKPADLPILRATKFELVINLQTARALDIEVPPGLLARADEVIE